MMMMMMSEFDRHDWFADLQSCLDEVKADLKKKFESGEMSRLEYLFAQKAAVDMAKKAMELLHRLLQKAATDKKEVLLGLIEELKQEAAGA